jgi:hypothetical protein
MALALTTRTKNSGILRYTYGDPLQVPPGFPPPQFPPLQGGAFDPPGEVVYCLSANVPGPANTPTPDSDDQVFGPTPGYPEITNIANTIFSGGIPAANAVDPGPPLPPGTGRAMGYIPGGTKVFAFFVMSDIQQGLSTEVPNIPVPIVQVDVRANRIIRDGVADPDGPLFLSMIRVGVRNVGDPSTFMAGTLIVELQHSEHDIPGVTQSLIWRVTPPG